MKSQIASVADGLGFKLLPFGIVAKQNRVISGMHHTRVLPEATYSPWLDDRIFQESYTAVKDSTLVDVYRCFELWDLVGQLSMVPGNILEVGVWRGGTGALIAKRCQGHGKLTYLCDTFAGVVKTSSLDSSYVGGEHADTSVDHVERLLASLSVTNAKVLKGIFPDDFASAMDNEQFCFVHIDVDVYQSAKEVMAFVWPRMAPGALVVFDDYGFFTCDGIAKLVAEYRGDGDKLVLHNLNGHAVIVKR